MRALRTPSRPDTRRRKQRGPVALLLLAGCLLEASCQESPWQEREIATDAAFRDVFFLDATRGWIVGGGHNVDGGILGETIDGGETWRFRTGIVADPQSRLFHLNAVFFSDPVHGVIAAHGGRLLRTVDGGANWHTLLRAGRTLNALFFLDESRGWAAGEQWVLRSEDGGASWERMQGQRSGIDFRARAIFFIDPERGWLVGHHGAIRHTHDAGRSWERVEALPELGSVVLHAVQFATPEIGWIVGEDGCILHTGDGGASWEEQRSRVRADLTDLHFVDAERGWIVGYDPSTGASSVLHTSDRGATWTVQATIEGEALRALFFERPDRAWAVGDRVRRQPQRLLRYAPAEP